jgi:hypothetical protein
MQTNGQAQGDVNAELLRTWNRALYAWWDRYNTDYARGGMRRPVIVLSSSQTELGTWDGARRQIAISERHLRADDWLDVMATLRHEMAHQYAEEVLGARGEPPHGAGFARACEILRVSKSANARNGSSAVDSTGEPGSSRSRILDVVKKLFALSGSPNENEAAAAMHKAHRLLAKYNIETVELGERREFQVARLGPLRSRHHAFEYTLGTILNEFFFVEVIWAASFDAGRGVAGSVLEVYGTQENVRMAEYVHAYLWNLLGPLWEEYKLERGLDSDRERLRYYLGVLTGFLSKLRKQGGLLREEGLVYKGDSALRDFYRWHNPSISTRTTGTRPASRAYDAGRSHGAKLSIRKPLERAREFGGFLRG